MTARRSRRAGVEDRWRRADGAPSAAAGTGKRWRGRYVDDAGVEHAQGFVRKIDAQHWIDDATTGLTTGTYIDPETARTTVADWVESWLLGYATRRASTVRQAQVHAKLIVAAFGSMQLSAVRPSMVKAWTAQLKREGRADSYVYALHNRLSQIMSDAVHDGIVARNPCSRRTSPGAAKQRAYVATTDQIWRLYDEMPAGLRPAILLGAFAGLRLAEIAALRVEDVDFLRGIVSPVIQWPGKPLKSESSYTPVPIPRELATMLASALTAGDGSVLVANELGRPAGPWVIERGLRAARARVDGLPEGFRMHDLRHYFASLLIASGLDVKNVQTRMRHSSAVTTLDLYAHLWPDSDESTRAVVAGVLTTRAESPADGLRTQSRA